MKSTEFTTHVKCQSCGHEQQSAAINPRCAKCDKLVFTPVRKYMGTFKRRMK